MELRYWSTLLSEILLYLFSLLMQLLSRRLMSIIAFLLLFLLLLYLLNCIVSLGLDQVSLIVHRMDSLTINKSSRMV